MLALASKTRIASPKSSSSMLVPHRSGLAPSVTTSPLANPQLPRIQPKLVVNQPGDKYEQEADRVAQKVMTLPESDDFEVSATANKMHRKESPYKTANVSSETAANLNASKNSGQLLPKYERAYFESRFEHDFSQVRIHANSQADESAKAINARAFTIGSDILFGKNQYAPQTVEGRKLIAHELVHVIQNEKTSNESLIKRYEGYEHQDIGDRHLNELLQYLKTEEGAQWARTHGYQPEELIEAMTSDPFRRGQRIRVRGGEMREPVGLTPGEITALMGDFYGSTSSFANAPREEIEGILNVMEEERFDRISSGEATLRYEEITEGRYLKLAERNETHFATRNQNEWLRLHLEALQKAGQAHSNNSEQDFQQALFIDAAAVHFLTDAYAAGHIFNLDELLPQIQLYLLEHPPVAQNPEMQTYLGIVELKGKMHSLVLKNIHDHLNTVGVEVSNNKGMTWRTFGDDHLRNSQETQRISALAVFLSRQQIHQKRRGETPDTGEILGLLPNEESTHAATQQAINYLPEAVNQVEQLMYRARSTSRAVFGPILGTIIESNISTVGSPTRQLQLEQMLESANRAGLGSVVAPQFTILDF